MEKSEKGFVPTLLLCLFLGCLGIHRFYVGKIGTGILIEKDNPSQFAEALISFFLLSEISERVKNMGTVYETDTLKMVNKIPDETLKSLVLLDPDFILKVKENCFKRVENNFRWKRVSEKLGKIYSKLGQLH